MPHYFFHLYNDVTTRDEEGAVFPDLIAARANAIHEIRSIATENVLDGAINLSHRIEIEDENGRVLTSVSFGDAVAIRGQKDL